MRNMLVQFYIVHDDGLGRGLQQAMLNCRRGWQHFRQGGCRSTL
jgi:hypothetical protein